MGRFQYSSKLKCKWSHWSAIGGHLSLSVPADAVPSMDGCIETAKVLAPSAKRITVDAGGEIIVEYRKVGREWVAFTPVRTTRFVTFVRQAQC